MDKPSADLATRQGPRKRKDGRGKDDTLFNYRVVIIIVSQSSGARIGKITQFV